MPQPEPIVLQRARWLSGPAAWQLSFTGRIVTTPAPPPQGNFAFFRGFLEQVGFTASLDLSGSLRFTGGGLAANADRCVYAGGPPDLLSPYGAVLAPFDLPLPFP